MSNLIMKFTQPNIDAIRLGRKTQTRRPMKPQPCVVPAAYQSLIELRNGKWMEFDSRYSLVGMNGEEDIATFEPRYKVGDVVRVADPDGVETDLLIRITGVRAERLQDISDEDCGAEGCRYGKNLRGEFRVLWSTIYGPDNQFAWDRNPWVFIYEFEVVA